VTETSATEAARHFAELLDAVEHRGERIMIVRRGKAIACIEPVTASHGSDVKTMLRRHAVDRSWRGELDAIRELVTIEARH